MDLPLQAQPPSLAQHCNSLIGVSRRISAHRDPQELVQNLPAGLRQIVQLDGLAVLLHEESINAVSLAVLDLRANPASRDTPGTISDPAWAIFVGLTVGAVILFRQIEGWARR